jgi:hypothetical protein
VGSRYGIITAPGDQVPALDFRPKLGVAGQPTYSYVVFCIVTLKPFYASRS